MLAGFEATASEAGITNVRSILGDWLEIEPPRGTFALVNHVTYLTREIVPFIEKLEVAASRRVLMTVNSPPLPSRNRELFRHLPDIGHVALPNSCQARQFCLLAPGPMIRLI